MSELEKKYPSLCQTPAYVVQCRLKNSLVSSGRVRQNAKYGRRLVGTSRRAIRKEETDLKDGRTSCSYREDDGSPSNNEERVVFCLCPGTMSEEGTHKTQPETIPASPRGMGAQGTTTPQCEPEGYKFICPGTKRQGNPRFPRRQPCPASTKPA